MILTDQDIRQRVSSRHLNFFPKFEESRLGSNSYDFTLGNKLLLYTEDVLDCKTQNPYRLVDIPEEGYVLAPGGFYLGFTNERVDCDGLCPQLEGKSSIARLGICVHLTAGFGDIGFNGHWTLEITAAHAVRIYPNMPIAQIYFLMPLGKCTKPYGRKTDAKYVQQPAAPVPSQMWKNFVDKPGVGNTTFKVMIPENWSL